MVGSALLRAVPVSIDEVIVADRSQLDLTNQSQVFDFLAKHRPDVVIIAAAKVGGIHANNTYPADFIYQNLMMQANVIEAAFQNGVQKLLFLGSSCIYPRTAQQPMREDALLTGTLEPTNEPYAIAKIAGIKLCESYNRQYGASHGVDYRSVMPTNLYGPNDNFDLQTSHVLPAMMRKFHEAKLNNNESVTLWGSGTPMREFLHVADLAEAVVFTVENKFEDNLYNVGTGVDLTIKDLAELIQKAVGHQGEIIWDSTKPDGTPRKLMDVTKLKSMGWQAKITLEEGIKGVYKTAFSIA